MPTDKGYRFFVDHLTTPGALDGAHRAQIGEFFQRTHGALGRMLSDTSKLLAQLTNYAAVVLGPATETAVVRSIQLVSLSSRVVMVVVVLSNGKVDNMTIDFEDEVSEARVAAGSVYLTQHLGNRPLPALLDLPSSGDADLDALLGRVTDTVLRSGEDDERVYLGGVSSMATAFDAVEVVRTVLNTLEQQFVVVTLINDILDRGLSVAIGNEHGVEPLSTCSVIVAPVFAEGEQLGTIGVLGPTRMNYPQALAAVEVVSDQLGRRLVEG
ncbi:MAG: hypothetical protein R2715_15925 [Ilumatobacteraceae bacterium]